MLVNLQPISSKWLQNSRPGSLFPNLWNNALRFMHGKWAAYELDGNGFHTCKQQLQQQREQTKKLTLEMMDIRLKRVEKMLFNTG
ncbi:MAG: hypothetical protein WA421_14965 [Nitrososphaeraceae archaeon]